MTPARGNGAAGLSEFAAEVRAGLLREGQKTLPCRYLYDDVGSALFEAISALAGYGLTRADARIVRARAGELIDRLPGPLVVVELGSGSGAKTRWVLEALNRREPAVYYPIDISGAALAACRKTLGDVARVEPLQASYLDGLREVACLRRPGQRLLVLFLGSTIGNFNPEEAACFLARVRGCLMPQDAFLAGTDLEKPERRMIEAYDDPAGVTAAFNLNLLSRINHELGGDFDLRRYTHQARYDRSARRIEMHLRARRTQRVRIPAAGVDIALRRGETIWTESSYKFRLPDIRTTAERAGFRCAAQWVDEEWPFSENLLLPAA
jgi:L-histidine Nalpha-methyltransferase